MRKGIDSDHLTYLERRVDIARVRGEQHRLHARTASEFYSGHADWSAIAKLKETVSSVPVLGNGDICRRRRAQDGRRNRLRRRRRGTRMPRQAVAVRRPGSGVPGRRASKRNRPSARSRRRFKRHAELLVEFFDGDENHACRDIRKHVAWYFKGYAVGGETRAALAMAAASSSRGLIGTLDANQPYPGVDAEGQRGRAGTPKNPTLPYGWLDSREIAEACGPRSPRRTAHSGG